MNFSGDRACCRGAAGEWAHVVLCRAPCTVPWGHRAEHGPLDLLVSLPVVRLPRCGASHQDSHSQITLHDDLPCAGPCRTPRSACIHTLNSPRFALGGAPLPPVRDPLPRTRTDYSTWGHWPAKSGGGVIMEPSSQQATQVGAP